VRLSRVEDEEEEEEEVVVVVEIEIEVKEVEEVRAGGDEGEKTSFKPLLTSPIRGGDVFPLPFPFPFPFPFPSPGPPFPFPFLSNRGGSSKEELEVGGEEGEK
jgi:hypothetical protein